MEINLIIKFVVFVEEKQQTISVQEAVCWNTSNSGKGKRGGEEYGGKKEKSCNLSFNYK